MSNILGTTTKINERKQLVSQGTDLLLSLFDTVGQRRLFPRRIMTKNTKGQITVHSKSQILYWFEQANYQDCRINAYPAFVSEAEEQDYKQGIGLNLLTPNILFIDLDLEHFKSKEELNKWLNRILNNIANVLHGVKPLVLWSGHGYHIIITVKASKALEQFEDFETYTNEPSKEFLQFAERRLSLSKADDKNSPAFRSCLLRVPYTFNSECLEEKIDAEVKIIHHRDDSQLPEINDLLIEFQTFLVNKKLKLEINQKKTTKKYHNFVNDTNTWYVEKLLSMQIQDHRKFAISLILAPYFVNIQHLPDSDSFRKIRQWTLNCNEIRRLEPSVEYFEDLIKTSLERVKKTKIKPLKFKETLRFMNKELYTILS